MTKPRVRPLIAKALRDCLTGPDGSTYAFGRIAAAIVLAAHLGGVTAGAVWAMIANPPTLTDFAAFVVAVAGTLPLVTEGVQRLVRLTNCVDSA